MQGRNPGSPALEVDALTTKPKRRSVRNVQVTVTRVAKVLGCPDKLLIVFTQLVKVHVLLYVCLGEISVLRERGGGLYGYFLFISFSKMVKVLG